MLGRPPLGERGDGLCEGMPVIERVASTKQRGYVRPGGISMQLNILSALLVAAAISGCAGADPNADGAVSPQQVCTPGAQVACACSDSTMGAQACSSSGTKYEACQCTGGSTGSASGGTSVGASGATTSGSGSTTGTPPWLSDDAGKPNTGHCSYFRSYACPSDAGLRYLYDCEASGQVALPPSCSLFYRSGDSCGPTTTFDPASFILGCDTELTGGFSL